MSSSYKCKLLQMLSTTEAKENWNATHWFHTFTLQWLYKRSFSCLQILPSFAAA